MSESLISSILNDVASHAYANAKQKGFHDGDPPPEVRGQSVPRVAIFIANLHGECSKLWEAARANKLYAASEKADLDLTNAEEALAGILTRTLDAAYSLNVDIGAAVVKKMHHDQTRARLHGGKLA